MSLLSRLFGGKSAPAAPQSESFEGFTIYPEPQREGSTYRLRARITGEIDGETKEHLLIRADTLESEDAAIEAAVMKAKQVITEQGNRLFD